MAVKISSLPEAASVADNDIFVIVDTAADVTRKVAKSNIGIVPASDVAYNATTWDNVTTISPSKNAVRDKIVAIDTAVALKAAKGANADITSMTGLNDDGIPLAKVANAASDGANADITSLTALAGAQTIPTINLTGGQIAFPAAAVPSADPNTLDDYEEGTFTPVLAFGGASVGITYTVQEGSYVKTGKGVIVRLVIYLSNKGISTGAATITGLPFTVVGIATLSMGAPLALSFADFPTAYLGTGGTVVSLWEITNAGARTTINNTDFANNTYLPLSGSYIS